MAKFFLLAVAQLEIIVTNYKTVNKISAETMSVSTCKVLQFAANSVFHQRHPSAKHTISGRVRGWGAGGSPGLDRELLAETCWVNFPNGRRQLVVLRSKAVPGSVETACVCILGQIGKC